MTTRTLLDLAAAGLLLLLPLAACSDATTAPAGAGGDDGQDAATLTYPIVDTGQTHCYDEMAVIAAPAAGEPYHGQDAQVAGRAPSYRDDGDGTVTDLVTGLMWQQDAGDKMSLAAAEAAAETLALAGHTDWRIPTIKELYSLIRFDGTDPSGVVGDDTSLLTPFLDPVFAFRYGDPDQGERIIDAQYLSSTLYISTTMNGDATVFGVNLADGRIKGYPVTDPRTGQGKLFFALFVRGGDGYGENAFLDDGDGTVTDAATGLMWMQQDSGHLGAGVDGGMTWEEALAWADSLTYAGHDDWRLPDAKELQSLVDYTRSPATHGTAAIDPIFACSPIVDEEGGSDFGFYWSSTTHAGPGGEGRAAAYVAFGTGYGYMETPPGSGQYSFWDVHGAGCQRSDPKIGDPADYPYGHGPQGDVIRIRNLVRCVRVAE